MTNEPSQPEENSHHDFWDETRPVLLRLQKLIPGDQDLKLLFDLLNNHLLGLDEFCLNIEGVVLNISVGENQDPQRLTKKLFAFATLALKKLEERQEVESEEKRKKSAKTSRIRIDQIISKKARTEKVLHPSIKEWHLNVLHDRFQRNMHLHRGIEWSYVRARLDKAPAEKLWSLHEMEKTGGAPDVVGIDSKTGEIIFYDCSIESPSGRRNVVYDRAAQDWLQKNNPNEVCNGNAVDMAAAMQIQILSEQEYTILQGFRTYQGSREEIAEVLKMQILSDDEYMIIKAIGCFDKRTWSWLQDLSGVITTDGGLIGSGSVHGIFKVIREGTSRHDELGAFRGSLRV